MNKLSSIKKSETNNTKMNTSNEDITTLKNEIAQLKHELKQKDQLLCEKDAELRGYISMVTHELKTPIVAMRGYSFLLRDFYQQDLNEELVKYLERISINLDKIEKLIDDLSEFSRIKLSEDECESVNVGKVVDEAVLEIEHMTKDQQFDIIIQRDFPIVHGHKNLLTRVFTNLLSNAVKYSNSNKKKVIEIGYQGDEIFHKFFVKDNGIGIPASKRDQLFKIFSRLHENKKINGSGLGLAITKRIVNIHGGEIWAESAVGKGTTFYFTLPRKG